MARSTDRAPHPTARANTLLGAGCLGGIGFTMALFIASLSLAGLEIEAAKSGILVGSAASLCLGLGLLAWTLRPAVHPGTGNAA